MFFILGLSNEPINLCLTRADIQDSDMMLLTLVVETTAIALSIYSFFAEIAVWKASCCKPTTDSWYVVVILCLLERMCGNVTSVAKKLYLAHHLRV